MGIGYVLEIVGRKYLLDFWLKEVIILSLVNL